MAVVEQWQSRSTTRATGAGGQNRITLLYTITGTNEDAIAEAELTAAAPTLYSGMVRTSVGIEWRGQNLWKGTAEYGVPSIQNQEPQPLGVAVGRISYSTGSQTANIKTSLSTVAAYDKDGVSTADNKQVINEHQEGIDGVDIQKAAPVFSLSYVFTAASITPTYLQTVEGLAYTVNDATFMSRPAGSVLFLGANMEMSDGQRVNITYDFAISKNETAITVGAVTVATKDGWDYLWTRYKDEEETALHYVRKVPDRCYVERVYPRTSFALLGIGV